MHTASEILQNMTEEQRLETANLLRFKGLLPFGFTFNSWGIVDCPADSICKAQVDICKGFITAFCHKTEEIDTERTSYFYKHCVEAAIRHLGSYGYCSNGAFIEAAVRLGYQTKRINNGPNVSFNMQLPKKYAKNVGYYGFASSRIECE